MRWSTVAQIVSLSALASASPAPVPTPEAYNPFFPPNVGNDLQAHPVERDALLSRAQLQEVGNAEFFDRGINYGGGLHQRYNFQEGKPKPKEKRNVTVEKRGVGESKRGLVRRVAKRAAACPATSTSLAQPTTTSSSTTASQATATSPTNPATSPANDVASPSPTTTSTSTTTQTTSSSSISTANSSSAGTGALVISMFPTTSPGTTPTTTSSSSQTTSSSTQTTSSSTQTTSSTTQTTSSTTQTTTSSTQTTSSSMTSLTSTSTTPSTTLTSQTPTSVSTTPSTTSTTLSASPSPTPSSGTLYTVDPDGNGPFSGWGTWFEDGLGACGWTNVPADPIVAVSAQLFDNWPGYNGWNPNDNPICGLHLNISWGGIWAIAEVADRCPGCDVRSLDFSEGLFEHFAALSVGLLGMESYTGNISWSWVEGTGPLPQIGYTPQ